ncbi:MAG: peptidylprolyl isomerase, partial [Paludibacteraceae bacterium]|nr:peptidylprolyl isomerase [Paludibacteraceae bacterium]
EYATAAFNLNDNKRVSNIVETDDGYHIIQLIEKRGDRINCRHILLRPHVSEDDKTRSLATLDSIKQEIDSGRLDFNKAVLQYSQDKNTVMNAGVMINQNTGSSMFEYQDLPPEIAKQVYLLKEGEISAPFVMMDETKNREVCAIVRVKKKIDIHRANLEDDFQMIRSMLEQKLSQEYIQKWIEQKQQATYIQIDPKWSGCDFQYPGWVKE